MYVGRFLADRAAGRAYFDLGAGLHDLVTRWIVTFQWDDWHREIPWMSLYFSVEVWLSIAFLHAPRITGAAAAATAPEIADRVS
jgi:hypothetical protein